MVEAEEECCIEQSEEEEGEIREDSDTAVNQNTKAMKVGKHTGPNEDAGRIAPKAHKRKDSSPVTERSSHKKVKKDEHKGKSHHHHDQHKHPRKEESQVDKSIHPDNKTHSYDNTYDAKGSHKHTNSYSLENSKQEMEDTKRKGSQVDSNSQRDPLDVSELEHVSKKRKERHKQKHHDSSHKKEKVRKVTDSSTVSTENSSRKREKRHHSGGNQSLPRERGLKESPPHHGDHQIPLDRPIKTEEMDDKVSRKHYDIARKKDKQRKNEKLRTTDDVVKEESRASRKGTKGDKDRTQTKDKDKPNFGLSGKLAEDTNMYNGVVIKYNEPPEARKPKRRWRLYPFKGSDSLPFIPIHRQSAYLLGRSRLVADIPTDHPSCSKQHAVLQFRLVDYEREDGTVGRRVRPYVIDLESSNGTFVNNKPVEARRFVELLEKDVIKFGFSTREYVLLHEDSKDEHEDDNVIEETT